MHLLNCFAKKTLLNRGFSLIELLMVFAVMLILVAVTLANFSSYARVQQFQRFYAEVGHELRLARQQTLGSKDDMAYGLYVGTSTVELFSGSTPTVGSAANTIISFPNTDATATSSFSNGEWFVTFERVTGNASATGTIVISSAELARTATYTIYQSGLVE